MPPPTQSPPSVSVLIPLVDTRGAAEQAVASWLAQAVPPATFEIVLVDSGQSPRRAARCRRLLRPGDRAVSCRSDNEAALYNAAAAAARAPVLLFTEAHVLATPGVIPEVLRHFADPGACAANLGSDHDSRTPLAVIDERLYEREAPAMQALGEWRCVGLRGLALRREAFGRFGPFDERYGRFAEIVLALALHEAGCRIDPLPHAVVRHVNMRRLSHLAWHMRTGARGLLRFYQTDPGRARAHLGPPPDWVPLAALDRAAARHACRAALASLRSRASWSQRLGLLAHLPGLALGALFGAAGERWLALARTILSQFRFHARFALAGPRPGEPLIDDYLAVRLALMRRGALEDLALQPPPPAARLEPGRAVRVVDLPEHALAGFFPPEPHEGRLHRWSGPVATLSFDLPPGDYRACFDIRATGGLGPRHPRLFFNAHALPPEVVREEAGCLLLDLPGRLFHPAGPQRLTLICEPFRPRRHGLPDPRDLGAAFFSARFDRVVAARLAA